MGMVSLDGPDRPALADRSRLDPGRHRRGEHRATGCSNWWPAQAVSPTRPASGLLGPARFWPPRSMPSRRWPRSPARGGPGARLFAFALMSVSMVHVLMRYVPPPRIPLASGGFPSGRPGPPAARPGLGARRCDSWPLAGSLRLWLHPRDLRPAPLVRARAALRRLERAHGRARGGGGTRTGCGMRQPRQVAIPRHHEPRTAHAAKRGARHGPGADARPASPSISSSGSALSAGRARAFGGAERPARSRAGKIEAGACSSSTSSNSALNIWSAASLPLHQPLAVKKGSSFEFEVAEAVRGRFLGDLPASGASSQVYESTTRRSPRKAAASP